MNDVLVACSDQLLFGGTDNCTIEVFDTTRLEAVHSLTGHQWEVWTLATAGDLLFSGSFDHSIKVCHRCV